MRWPGRSTVWASGPLSRRRLRAGVLPARQRARRRRPRAAGRRRARRARAAAKTEVYSVDHLHGMEPLFSDIYAGAAAQGIPAETVISEYAPGQYELTLQLPQGCDARRRRPRHAEAAGADAGAPPWRHRLLHGQADREICRLRHALPRLAAGRRRPQHLCRKPAARAGRWRCCNALGGLVHDHGRIDAGVCAARQFLAALRLAILCAGRRRPGASTTVRWRCACRRATPKPAHRAPAGRASTPTPIWSPRRCWPASPKVSTKDSIPAPKPPATATNGRHAGADAGRLARRDRGRQGLRLSEGRRWARTCTGPSPRSSRPNICASPARSANSTTTSICTRFSGLPDHVGSINKFECRTAAREHIMNAWPLFSCAKNSPFCPMRPNTTLPAPRPAPQSATR